MRFKEIIRGGQWFDLWFGKPDETDRIAHGSKPAREVFVGTLELFIQLAEESIRTGEPIVSC